MAGPETGVQVDREQDGRVVGEESIFPRRGCPSRVHQQESDSAGKVGGRGERGGEDGRDHCRGNERLGTTNRNVRVEGGSPQNRCNSHSQQRDVRRSMSRGRKSTGWSGVIQAVRSRSSLERGTRRGDRSGSSGREGKSGGRGERGGKDGRDHCRGNERMGMSRRSQISGLAGTSMRGAGQSRERQRSASRLSSSRARGVRRGD